MIVCNHPLFGVFQSSVSVTRLREFLKGNEIDSNNVERSEEPATGMYVHVSCMKQRMNLRIKPQRLEDETVV